MKREVWNHPKTLALAGYLDISKIHAAGIIGGLLNYTADVAPQGNIGKWPDEVIARACDWDGDPNEFVNALAKAGWLDEHPDPKHRFIIHDLEDHAENWWKQKVKKLNLEFIKLPQCEDDFSPAVAQKPPSPGPAVAQPSPSVRPRPSILQTSSNPSSSQQLLAEQEQDQNTLDYDPNANPHNPANEFTEEQQHVCDEIHNELCRVLKVEPYEQFWLGIAESCVLSEDNLKFTAKMLKQFEEHPPDRPSAVFRARWKERVKYEKRGRK